MFVIGAFYWRHKDPADDFEFEHEPTVVPTFVGESVVAVRLVFPCGS